MIYVLKCVTLAVGICLIPALTEFIERPSPATFLQGTVMLCVTMILFLILKGAEKMQVKKHMKDGIYTGNVAKNGHIIITYTPRGRDGERIFAGEMICEPGKSCEEYLEQLDLWVKYAEAAGK